MVSDFGKRLVEVIDELLITRMNLDELEYEGRNEKNPKAELAEPDRLGVPAKWKPLGEVCKELTLQRSSVTLERLLIDARHKPFTIHEYDQRLAQLDEDLRYDLEHTKFQFVPSTKTDMYDAGFGHKRTDDAFTAACSEIKESGICYALGRNTASVFHSMRAAEHGLRALARAVNAPDGGKVPLEYAMWDDVIRRAQSRINAVSLDAWSAPAKANFRAFYNGSVADFLAFKDECRNLLMHSRSGFYNEHEAMNWRRRVCDSMNRMSTKTDEYATKVLLDESDFLA